MQNDDVIQDILMEVNERGGDDAIEQSIQRHREEILKRYEQARNLIETCDIIDDPNRLKFQSKSEM